VRRQIAEIQRSPLVLLRELRAVCPQLPVRGNGGLGRLGRGGVAERAGDSGVEVAGQHLVPHFVHRRHIQRPPGPAHERSSVRRELDIEAVAAKAIVAVVGIAVGRASARR